MYAAPSLHAGFFISRDHKLIVFERLSFPLSLIEIQYASRFVRKIRIPRKDPAPMLPGADGVLVQPTPHRRLTQLSHQPLFTDVSCQLTHTPPGERRVVLSGQFASQRLDVNDDAGGGKRAGRPPRGCSSSPGNRSA